MLCSETCPKGLLGCKPLSNIVSTLEDGSPDPECSIVCVGLHSDSKDFPQDRFRHCFRSAPEAGTDTVFDYDEYDLQSTISVFAEALLIDGNITVSE